MGGQDRYGYRPDDGGGRGSAYGAGAGAARPADPYDRRAPEHDTPAPGAPGGAPGGYDPLGIRRAPADAMGVADPPRGPGGGDPYGYGRDGYGREAPAEDPRSSRSYPADPYGRDGYGRAPDERMREERGGYGGRGDERGPAAYAGRDERGGTYPGAGRGAGPDDDDYGRDRGGYPVGGGGRDADPYARDRDDRGGYGYDADPVRMGGSSAPPAPAAGRGTAAAERYLPCPNCRSLYEPGARFCETCGLDFTTGHLPTPPGAVPVDDPGATSRQSGPRRPADRHAADNPRMADPRMADPRMADPRMADPRAADPRMGDPRAGASSRGRDWDDASVSAGTWEAVVEAEREYYDSGDDHRVPFPAFYPRRVFALTESQMLVGRRSESRGIHPEIDLSGAPEDPGISRAHATLERLPDGTYAVRDPGSTNGTRINDEPDPIGPGRAIPLRDGDRVYLGAWTRITVRAR